MMVALLRRVSHTATTEEGMLRVFTHPREAFSLLRARMSGRDASMGAGGVQSYELSHKDNEDHSDDDAALTDSKTIQLEEIDLEDY